MTNEQKRKKRGRSIDHAWRKAVKLNAFYTCQRCGKMSADLECHHIKPFATHKRLRYDVSNGIALCRECHKKEHEMMDGE